MGKIRTSMPLETRRPVNQPVIFPPRRDYVSLSVKDLIDARDAYHVYLGTLQNVVATAIGRYLIHEDDWYAKHPPSEPCPPSRRRVTAPARTLENSVVRPWSWPAVLIFVKQWEELEKLAGSGIPRTLYLPDGRVIPTCVVLATPEESLPPSVQPSFSSTMLGGGYSCLREHQGQQSVGTFACLVRKRGTYYALTNRHVAGGDREEVRARLRGEYRRVGETSNVAADRIPMAAVFPQWVSPHTQLALDAGLIKIDDVGDWTSQAFGIGEIGDVFNATEQSVTLDLIGCPVRAFGGTSGVSEGEIRALFFRYESLGGYEYTTDVLIGPRKHQPEKPVAAKPFTGPGDSGTVWFYDPPKTQPEDADNPDFDNTEVPAERGKRARRLRPIAMQWGGSRVRQPDGSASAYALGVFLSSISRILDIEIVRDWSTGHDEYWGKIGHFAIGWKTCDVVTGRLGELMKMNQPRIGFGDDTLGEGAAFRMGRGGFVPLADVPDYVYIGMRGARPFEGGQHFADVDIYGINGGPTLLQRCIDDPGNVSATVWQEYFDGFAQAGVGPDEGCLPFRVWQIWEAMVKYLKDRDLKHFVAAAGILAHYVGDASQPLHCSYMHHGVPPTQEYEGRKYPYRHDSKEYADFKKSRASKIHGIYEETMLEVNPAEALAKVTEALRRPGPRLNVSSGYDDAVATVRLMDSAQRRLSPKSIVDADDPELTAKERAKKLWASDKIREGTIASLADSVRLLAGLWTAAWEEGGGDELALPKKAFEEADLQNIYRGERKFIPSLNLAEMVKSGAFEPPKQQEAGKRPLRGKTLAAGQG